MTKAKKRKTRNKAKKLRIILVFDMLLLTLLAGAFFWYEYSLGPRIIGDRVITVNAGEDFHDPGVRPFFAESESDLDLSVPGRYPIKYSLWGKTATRWVHVTDPEEIILGLKGSKIQIVRQGDPYVESGAYAIDRMAGALGGELISMSGGVNTDKPGDYRIKYSVKSRGIHKEAERVVRVVKKSDFDSCESVPVMMYHWVYSRDDMPLRVDNNWIEDTLLEEHLKYLKDNDYYYPSWKELSAWIDGRIALPEKSIIITFDDGKKAFLEHGIPLLEKYEIPATSFMICWEHNEAEEKIRKYASEYIDFESHSYEMHQAGHIRGHRGYIACLTEEEIAADLKKAADITGNNDAFAYPYGDYTPEGMDAVRRSGILCAVTIEGGKVTQGMDKTRLPRVRVFGSDPIEIWIRSVSSL